MHNDLIKKTIEDILGHVSVPVSKIEIVDGQFGIVFDIYTDNDTTLVDRDGESLLALSHIIKRIANNKTDRGCNNFTVDVNGFQAKRNDELKERVNIFAERAKSLESDIEMDPMNSYERMIAHTVLADEADLETESAGFGRDRRIVIKFKG